MEAEKQSSVWKNLMPFCGVPQPQSKDEGAAAAAKFSETQLKTIADAESLKLRRAEVNSIYRETTQIHRQRTKTDKIITNRF